MSKKITFASMQNYLRFLVVFGLAIFMFGCTGYNKILKSTDLEFKYAKALEYYDKKEYLKAYPIIEELVAIYRGQQRSEKLYYMYAYCDYYLEDYLLSAHRFGEFTKTFPTSKYAEECAFMAAISLYQMSPAPKLDQSNTYKAISSLQLFADRYPRSTRVDSCNTLIISLEGKLEEKFFKSANQYKKMENFTSSVITYENMLKDFPDTRYKEEIYFNIFDAKYLLAVKSVHEKKSERIDDAFKAYTNFANRFPNSAFMNDVNSKKAHLEKLKLKLEKKKR